MNFFTPLKTYQGLSIGELKTIINSRDIYIWGCGYLGLILKRHFDKNSLPVKSFCDSNPKLHMNYIDGVMVVPPKDIFDAVKQKRAFIIIASAQYKDEMERECISAGLMKSKDYLSHIHISRSESVVDVAGICNIKCPSCPIGNTEGLRPGGHMTINIYKQVLKKLLTELPQLINLGLSAWGEPFMNPDLAEIIQTTEMSLPCTLSTNLQLSDKLEKVIKAQPSQMIISVSGYGKTYEINHAGASWQKLLDNIYLLRKLIDKHNPKTDFIILYHLYKNNQYQDLDDWRKLCIILGLKLYSTWAYLNPYDKILDYCEGRYIGVPAKKVLDILPWDLNHAVELSKKEAHKPCLCQRIFPIINWDLSVSLCHTYYNPVITDNFLDISMDDLLKVRHKQMQCEMCQKYGLHRLDVDILLKKYSAESILKYNKKGLK